MTKQITWTTGTDKKATVTVELQTSKTINADGDQITVPCCELHVAAEVEGMGTVGTGEPQHLSNGPAAGRIGKLGLTTDNLTAVETAIDELKATPEWQAKVAKEARALAEGRKYEQDHNEINRAMSGSY